ncbi:Ldh family oxidoreductase [Dehalococcoidia bacterium]|nr:Ldh family oxidoreductase [Dehalococcoidia bacterium]
MLEHFKIPEHEAIRVSIDDLRSTTEEIFLKCGVSESDARLGADVLVFADSRGIDTHGVSNALRGYVRNYLSGTCNSQPKNSIIKSTPSTAVVDGDNGLGLMTAPFGMNIAIEKAKNTGIGVVSIRNSNHLGAAGYHAMMALEHDMIGWCMTGGGKAMVPTFGAEAQLGTNPIAFAAPTNKEAPFIFDAAMSSIAAGKITLARRLGQSMEPGWVANEDGTPNMESTPTHHSSQLKTSTGLEMQLPLGSTRELGSHKGYGLGVMVDILSGQLSFARGFASLDEDRRAHFVAAYAVSAFGEVEEFKNNMDEMLRGLSETKPMPGISRVLYAGQPEEETLMERTENGIPLHPEVIDWFKDICGELQIKYNLS